MPFTIAPISMISSPNNYTVLKDARWSIVSPNAQDLWGQLQVSDALGLRRYVPASGSTLSVVFQRGDLVSTSSTIRYDRLDTTTRSVTKNATLDSNDRSLIKIAMNTADIQGVMSGTVKFTLTEGAVVTTWVQNWALMKSLTDPGF